MLVLIVGAVRLVGSVTSNDLSLPGTGSQEAKDLLEAKFPPQQNGANPIVFDVSAGKLTDQQYQKAINDSVKAIKAEGDEPEAAVPGPVEPPDPVAPAPA